MKPHPLAEKFPLMSGDKYEKHKAHIEKHGLKVPIIRFEGMILDGRNRARALEELGIPKSAWAIKDFEGTLEQAAVLVEALNLERRNLTPEEERMIRAQLVQEMHAKGMSQRAIAEAVGVDEKTVRKDMKRQVRTLSAPEPAEGSDAKQREPPAAGGELLGVPGDRPDSHQPGSPEARNREVETRTGSSVDNRPGSDSKGPSDTPRSPDRQPQTVTGRDGKKYPANKSQPKRQAKPQKIEPQENSQGETPWSEIVLTLNHLASSIAATTAIPQDLKPWNLVESLEKTARSLLQRARELRRKHHL